MAKRSGMGQVLCIGGYDLSGDAGVVNEASSPRATQDVTGLNKTSVERILLRGDGRLLFNNWFNDASNQEFPVLKALPTADRQAVWGISNTLGDPACGLVCKQVNFDWAKRANGEVEGSVDCLGNASPLEWGRMLTAGVDTHTGATNGSAVDDGAGAAPTTAGIRAYLQVLGVSGLTTVTVAIQDSADGSTGWATILTFAAVTAARSVERKTATGTVRRYLRAITTGTFTAVDLIVMYQRGTAQDDESLA